MAFFNPSNQLLQIDTGSVSTYLYNPTTGFAPWAGLGENQVLGQRYFGVTATSAAINMVNRAGSKRRARLIQNCFRLTLPDTCCSSIISDVMRKPLTTKNTSTPMNPPGIH